MVDPLGFQEREMKDGILLGVVILSHECDISAALLHNFTYCFHPYFSLQFFQDPNDRDEFKIIPQ